MGTTTAVNSQLKKIKRSVTLKVKSTIVNSNEGLLRRMRRESKSSKSDEETKEEILISNYKLNFKEQGIRYSRNTVITQS